MMVWCVAETAQILELPIDKDYALEAAGVHAMNPKDVLKVLKWEQERRQPTLVQKSQPTVKLPSHFRKKTLSQPWNSQPYIAALRCCGTRLCTFEHPFNKSGSQGATGLFNQKHSHQNPSSLQRIPLQKYPGNSGRRI